jgi:hypothetical protein
MLVPPLVAAIFCGAGCQPAADWQSSIPRRAQQIEKRQLCLRLAAMCLSAANILDPFSPEP